MHRPLLSRLALWTLAASAPATGLVAAARELVAVEYLAPVTLELKLTRQLPAVATATGVKAPVEVVRFGNRDLLAPLAAEHGGSPATWRLLALAHSDTFDSLAELVLVARRSDGLVLPVNAFDLSALSWSTAQSTAYQVVKSADDELLSGSFDQKLFALCEQEIAGGTLQGSGTVEGTILYGPITRGGSSLRAFRPGRVAINFTGAHRSETEGDAVAELTIRIRKPRLVPEFVTTESSLDGGRDGIVIEVTEVSPIPLPPE